MRKGNSHRTKDGKSGIVEEEDQWRIQIQCINWGV
jgi:hypothetical protein